MLKLGSRAIRGESNAVCLFSGQTVSEIFTSEVLMDSFIFFTSDAVLEIFTSDITVSEFCTCTIQFWNIWNVSDKTVL